MIHGDTDSVIASELVVAAAGEEDRLTITRVASTEGTVTKKDKISTEGTVTNKKDLKLKFPQRYVQ